LSLRKDRRRVKAWMVMNNINGRHIQRALGHKWLTQVSETLSGIRDHRKVLAYLRDKGCPISYLQLPDDMKENQQ
jgi:hypothetical protein